MFLEGSCYSMDTCPFVSSEDLCEELRKIIGDHIFDVYDDADHVFDGFEVIAVMVFCVGSFKYYGAHEDLCICMYLEEKSRQRKMFIEYM